MNILIKYSIFLTFIHILVFFIHKKQLTEKFISGTLYLMNILQRRNIIIITTTTLTGMVVIG